MGTNGNGTAVMLTPQENLQARMADPRTIESLNALLDKLDVMTFTVTALDGFLRRGDQIMDSVGEGLRELQALAPDGDSLHTLTDVGKDVMQLGVLNKVPVLAQALVELADSGLLEKFPKLTQTGAQLVDSGIFEERTVGILASAGKALAESYGDTINKPHKAVGMGGLLKALGDPDIQCSLGLLLDFAKRFGQKINA